MMEKLVYFGYGSLVNRQTRTSNEPFIKARLNGWQREWAHLADHPRSEPWHIAGVCALTIQPQVNRSLDGVLGIVDATALPQLDEREQNYHRLTLPAAQFDLLSDNTFGVPLDQVIVYQSIDARYGWANSDFPITQSYIDCVISGYRQQFGPEGANRLMQSTEGWALPTIDDRADPLYPRAVQLDTPEYREIDALLAQYR